MFLRCSDPFPGALAPSVINLNIHRTIDKGSDEQLKKKLKSLEDQIKKLSGTNTALTDTVRVLRKENADTRRHADGGGDDTADSDSNEEESLALFAARKV